MQRRALDYRELTGSLSVENVILGVFLVGCPMNAAFATATTLPGLRDLRAVTIRVVLVEVSIPAAIVTGLKVGYQLDLA